MDMALTGAAEAVVEAGGRSVWEILWPAAAPRRWVVGKQSLSAREGLVSRIPLPVTPSPLLQYRLQVQSFDCDSGQVPASGVPVGPLWWPVLHYSSTTPSQDCFACENLFLPAAGLAPPAIIQSALEKNAFDDALHAPVGYHTEHKLSTHALRPHWQYDGSTTRGAETLHVPIAQSGAMQSELLLVADPACSYRVHLGAQWISSLGEVMLHRGSWLLTAGVAMTLLVMAAQHQEWWHRLSNRRGQMQEWSLQRRKVSLEWLA